MHHNVVRIDWKKAANEPGEPPKTHAVYIYTEVCRISATRALTYNSLLWAMFTSYSAQSVPYMEGNALCCCKDSANLCMILLPSA